MIQKEDLWNLPKNQLEDLRKEITHTIERKYSHSSKIPKYKIRGYKAFTSVDIRKFFNGFYPEDYRHKVMFITQAWLGLRIGETVIIRKEDVDLARKQIFIRCLKKKDNIKISLLLHQKLAKVLEEYILCYDKLIDDSGGWLFPAQNSKGHISTDYARKVFRKICDRQGLNEVYGTQENRSGDFFCPHGNLHRYSTHSLRHSFGRHLAKSKVPIEIARELLRHDSVSSTQIYYVPFKEDIDYEMERAFNF